MTLEEEYLAWNHAIAEELYPPLDYPKLVFLDIEGDALEKIARARGVETEDVVPTLNLLVQSLLDTSTYNSTFRWFEQQTKSWYARKSLKPPPALGLLVVLALAAERMERSEGLSSSNYYGQLSQLLELDEKYLGQAYRSVSDLLWDSLTTWLNQFGGKRGRPVDFTIGNHSYIGKPRAQALVRDVDKRRLQSFFQEFDLSPHTELEPHQLEPLLDVWINNSYTASSQLRELWGKDDVRPHLITAISDVLASWDGEIGDGGEEAHLASRVRLAMSMEGMRQALRVAFVFEVPRHEEPRLATLSTPEGEHRIELSPHGPGEMIAPELPDLLSPETILETDITVKDAYGGVLTHKPRGFVAFRLDPATGVWVEVVQTRLGDELKILTHNNYQHHGYPLEELLADISGTDWTIKTRADHGEIPEGWALIEGIVVSGYPAVEKLQQLDDRNTLTSITTSALELSGGVKIPTQRGATPHYHCDHPPVFTASAEGQPFTLALLDILDGHEDLMADPWVSNEGESIVVNLHDLELDPGHYTFVMIVQGKERRRPFWLVRSGTKAGVTWEYEPITHHPHDPLFAINRPSGSPADNGHTIKGIPTFTHPLPGVEKTEIADHLRPTPWWRRERARTHSPRRVGRFSEQKCVWDNTHYIIIEQATIDETFTAQGTSKGVCKHCGREQIYSNNYKSNNARWVRQQLKQHDRRRPQQVKAREKALGTSVDWDLAWDVVATIGGGTHTQLRHVTNIFDPSSRFYHEFLTTLETLGHIEVRRDLHTGEVTHWETLPPTIIDSNGVSRFVGRWTTQDIQALTRAGITITWEAFEDSPSRITTTASPQTIQQVIPHSQVGTDPAHTLAATLPQLSQVVANLPTTSLPDATRWERYDAATDSWNPTPYVGQPGAYRATTYTRQYFLVNEEDLAHHQGRVVNVTLAKHAAAMMDHRYPPLLAYSEADEQLVVPLGANLPGMYGRCATLISGQPPRRRNLPNIGSYVIYDNLPAPLAHRLVYLMGS